MRMIAAGDRCGFRDSHCLLGGIAIIGGGAARNGDREGLTGMRASSRNFQWWNGMGLL